METKKILIIGAGISGLSLAINLEKLNIPFRIIEKQSKWNKKGLAITIQGEGLNSASSMGILDEIRSQGTKRNLSKIYNSKEKILKQFIPDPFDNSFIVQRDILHEALRASVDKIEMDTSVSEIKETNKGIDIFFSNGSTDNFSLIVGADGINSKTLNLIRNTESSALHSGSVIWGIRVKKKYTDIIEVWGNNGMCALYPVKEGTVFSFFRKAPKTFQSQRSERASHLKKYFSSYPQAEIKEVLENLPEDIFFDHVRYTRPEKWNIGHATLIGDACHSLSPLSGLGANLAMADAMGLAKLILEYGDNDNFLEALGKYNSKRKKEADKAYYLSKMRTKKGMLTFPGSIFRDIKMKQSGWEY